MYVVLRQKYSGVGITKNNSYSLVIQYCKI